MKTTGKIKKVIWMVVVVLLSYIASVAAQENGLNISGFEGFKGSEKSTYFTSDTIAYAHFLSGIQFDADGDYESAIEEYSEAIKYDIHFAVAYDRRGIDYTMLIKYRKALKDFNKAIELKSNFTDAYSHRGIVNYCLRDFVNAIADYNKALNIDPKYDKAYYNRGIVKFLLDDENGAIADIRIASEMNNSEAMDYLKTMKSVN
jgi:Tetratricopeptide repeat.